MRAFARDVVLRLPGLRRFKNLIRKLELAQDRVDALESKLAVFKRRLAEEEQERSALRGRLDQLGVRLTAARGGAAARLGRLREALHVSRRAAPSSDVLASLMPIRHAALLRSRHAAEARAEHAARLETSPVYRAAFEAASDAIDADRLELNGVTLWVPRDARGAGSLSDRLHRGQLPLRDILRTREVSMGRVMIDIGANIGTTSIPRIVLGDVERVFAAEPEPLNFACLVRSIRDNALEGLIVPAAVALSDREGELAIDLGSHIGTHRMAKGPAAGRPSVRTTTLDIWVRELGVDLDALAFIKCDTQGHEALVLRGAADVLSRRQTAWQIEFSPGHLRRHDLADLYALLARHFDWFIDIGDRAVGDRVRPIAALVEATSYVVERRDVTFTNLLLFNGLTA